jgi:tripartite-type tricarboxylate transporter receptor subunit TctC
LSDFISAAKKSPNQFTYGFGGNGTVAHVTFARFAAATEIDLLPVAYKSGPSALQDLMGGQIDAMLDGAPLLEPHIKAGKLRALAVATKSRLPSLPDVPTIAESGYPDFEAVIWVGMAVKKGTPADTISKLNSEVSAALQSQVIKDAYARAGASVRQSGVKAFTDYVASEDKLWTPVLQKAKISIE